MWDTEKLDIGIGVLAFLWGVLILGGFFFFLFILRIFVFGFFLWSNGKVRLTWEY